ncbi:MAG: hypothetical protein GY943_03900 [Chloroflexi bacterium]|nr:hypothetical protein [Chloroflexota bacterium]
MANPNQNGKLTIIRLILIMAVIFVGIVVGMIVWQLPAAKNEMRVDVERMASNILGNVGTSCDLQVNLFDATGILFVFPLGQNSPDESHSYLGAAPLFGFNSTTLPQFDEFICDPPRSIRPDHAVQGQEYYPLFVTISMEDTRVARGEGAVLAVTAVIEENYEASVLNQKVVYAVPLDPAGELPLSFDVNTTTFRFSPDNANSSSFILTKNQAATQQWSLTPVAEAVGKQTILLDPVITLTDGSKDTLNSIQIDLQVTEARGILSVIITAITTLVSLGTAALGAVKVYQELKKMMDKASESDTIAASTDTASESA